MRSFFFNLCLFTQKSATVFLLLPATLLVSCSATNNADHFVGKSSDNVSVTVPTVLKPVLFAQGTLNFPVTAAGSSQSITLNLVNAGNDLASLQTASFSASSGLVSALSTTADTCSNQVLLAGASCFITVQFAPSVSGSYSGSWNVSYQGSGSGSYSVSLPYLGSGIQAQPNVVSAPTSYAFALTSVGSSVSQNFIVSNNSVGVGTFQSATISGSGYSISTDGCSSAVLSSTSSPSTCTVTVAFAPVIPGSTLGILTLNFQNSSGVAQSVQVPLSGVGNAPQPTLSFSPVNPSFGSQTINTAQLQSITLSNTSTVSATLGLPSFTNSGFSKFASTCESGGSAIVLGAGNSCVIQVRFLPTAIQAYTSVLSIGFTSQQGITSTLNNTLTGAGIAPQVSFSFSGFTGVLATDTQGSVLSTGLTLKWTAQPLASYYVITQSGSAAYVSPHITPTSLNTYNITGLTPGATYQFKINAFDSNGVSDGNNNLLTVTTPNTTGSTFAGWSDVVSLGSVYTDIGAVDTVLGKTGSSRMERNLAQVAGFGSSNISLSDGKITVSTNPFSTGQRVTFNSDGTDPGGLTSGSVYYVINVNSTTIQLATSSANALAGTAIIPSSAGSGNMTAMPKGVVKIGWDLFSIAPSGSASSYNIYRSTNATSGFAKIGTSAINSYVDYEVNDSTHYYYYVYPVVASVEVPAPTANDSVIDIYVPDRNMAGIHRWIANREACTTLLGFTWPAGVNRNDQYSCAYTWGGGYASHTTYAKSKWDVGYSMVTDRWQTACKMGAWAGSSGLSAPAAGLGSAGQVYTRISNTNGSNGNQGSILCYYKDASLGWVSEPSLPASNTAGLAAMRTNFPGYSATSTTQIQAAESCKQRTPANLVDGNGNSRMRLPRLYEYNLIRAIQGVNVNNRSSTVLNTILNGTNLPVNGSCNLNAGQGGFMASDPSVFVNMFWHLINGTVLSRNCYSRYEVSTLWDYASEWMGTQYYQTATGAGSYLASGVDPGDNLLEDFALNGTTMGVSPSGIAWLYGTGGTSVLPLFGIYAQAAASSVLGTRVISSSPIDYATTPNNPTGGISNNVLHGVITGSSYYGTSGGRFNYSNFPSLNVGMGTATSGQVTTMRCLGQVAP